MNINFSAKAARAGPERGGRGAGRLCELEQQRFRDRRQLRALGALGLVRPPNLPRHLEHPAAGLQPRDALLPGGHFNRCSTGKV